MKNLSPRIRHFIVFVPFLLLSACKADVVLPSGDVAMQQRDLLIIATLLMLLIIVPVMILTVVFAWHYRASNKDAKYMPDWDHSTMLELVIWAAPLLIIISLGAITWVGTHLLDPFRPLDRISAEQPEVQGKPVRVEVVSLDWKWLFIYPDLGVATVNELAVPVDRAVNFTLTSDTVMTAFYVPAMAGMIYTMPGMETKLHAVMNKEGVYQGLASQYSGHGFSGMRFKTHAVTEAAFEDWIAKVKSSGTALDIATFKKLEVPSSNVEPEYFGSVVSGLFHRVSNLCVDEGSLCMDKMMAIDMKGGTEPEEAVDPSKVTFDKNERRGGSAMSAEQEIAH